MPRYRRLLTLAVVAITLSAAGCTDTRTDGGTTTITFAWWVPVLAGLGGVLAVAVGLLVRRRTWWGWALVVGGPVVAVVVGPGLALDQVVVGPDTFTLRTGFWFDPTIHEVQFADLRAVTATAEEKRGRRGSKTISYYFLCAKHSGGTVKIPLGDLMKEGGIEAFRAAIAGRNILYTDSTGGL